MVVRAEGGRGARAEGDGAGRSNRGLHVTIRSFLTTTPRACPLAADQTQGEARSFSSPSPFAPRRRDARCAACRPPKHLAGTSSRPRRARWNTTGPSPPTTLPTRPARAAFGVLRRLPRCRARLSLGARIMAQLALTRTSRRRVAFEPARLPASLQAWAALPCCPHQHHHRHPPPRARASTSQHQHQHQHPAPSTSRAPASTSPVSSTSTRPRRPARLPPSPPSPPPPQLAPA